MSDTKTAGNHISNVFMLLVFLFISNICSSDLRYTYVLHIKQLNNFVSYSEARSNVFFMLTLHYFLMLFMI